MKLLLILAGLTLATPSLAEEGRKFGIETGLSTLGIYVAPTATHRDSLSFRVPIYLASVSRDFKYDGNDVSGDFTTNSIALMADYALGESGFRVSGGLAIGGYALEATISDPVLNERPYDGTFTATLEQANKVAPVISVGYTRKLGKRIGFMTEFGARISDMELSTTGQELLSEADRLDFEEDIAEINSDLGGLGFIPFITIGVTYTF